MFSTKDVSTMPAVVPPFKEIEMLLAHGCVTNCGTGIGFPVFARWWVSHFGEICSGNRGWGGFVFTEFAKRALKCAAVSSRSFACWSVLGVI
jgi:hypothetical protein